MLNNHFKISSYDLSMTLTIFQTINSTPCINMKIGAQSGCLNTELLAKGVFFGQIPLIVTLFSLDSPNEIMRIVALFSGKIPLERKHFMGKHETSILP